MNTVAILLILTISIAIYQLAAAIHINAVSDPETRTSGYVRINATIINEDLYRYNIPLDDEDKYINLDNFISRYLDVIVILIIGFSMMGIGFLLRVKHRSLKQKPIEVGYGARD